MKTFWFGVKQHSWRGTGLGTRFVQITALGYGPARAYMSERYDDDLYIIEHFPNMSDVLKAVEQEAVQVTV